MKYKLINSVTKKETICDKVTIDGFDYYVSDNKPKLGDFYVDDTNQIRQGVTDDEEYWDRRSGYKIIIATNNPTIDIPKVVDEVDEINNLIWEAYKSQSKHVIDEITVGFQVGYNKSKETHPFSEEDMIEFAKWVNKNRFLQHADKLWSSSLIEYSGCLYTTKELLQLWKEQKPKIVYYE